MSEAKNMYQVSGIKYQFTLLIAPFVLALTALSSHASAQTKSLESAQAEAAGTPGVSIAYEENRYLTVARITADSLPANKLLNKQFKRFEWTLETWFAIKGIDAKPARVVLCLATRSKRFAFTSDRDLTLTFDGEDVLLGEAQRSTEVKGGKARENLCWEVDEVITKDFAGATSAGFSIASVRGIFSPDDLSRLRSYGRLVTSKD